MSPVPEYVQEALGLFDAQTSHWHLTNPHTLGNIRYALKRSLLTGDLSIIDGTCRHYFKEPYASSLAAELRRIVLTTPGVPEPGTVVPDV